MTLPPDFYLPDGRPLPGHEIRNGNGALAVGAKDDLVDVRRRSVVDEGPGTTSVASTYVLWSWGAAEAGFVQWGLNTKMRDRQLRAFWPSETMLAGAMATVAARNAAMSWKISGDERTALAAQQMLNNANFGGGWEEFVAQVSLDLYSQDAGAFVESIRAADSPEAPVIGVAHLDAARCYPTGNPQFPIIYEDSRGRHHRLPWYAVTQLLEMPSPVQPGTGSFIKTQYSAVTRALRAAQIMKSIAIYKDEKVSGRFTRAVHLISGVSQQAVQDAIARAQAQFDAQGLTHYSLPIMVGSVDPNAAIKHDTLEMASLPDQWNEKESVDIGVLLLSMAFLTDYQEFAPLPGGNLGTSAQSQTLHQKSRGKGPGLFQKLMLFLMNQRGVLPANVLFEFDEQDAEADKLDADTRKIRAETRAARVSSGELDRQTARDIALREGDLTQEEYDAATERGAEAERAEAEQRQVEMERLRSTFSQPREGEDGRGRGRGDAQMEGEDGRGARSGVRSIGAYERDEWLDLLADERAAAEGVPFGNLISGRLHRAYSTAADDAHSLGYFDDTDERKLVGEAIGPALAVFEEALRDAGIWDRRIAAEDADRIVNASLGLMQQGERAISAPESAEDEERLDYEADVGVEISRALAAARRVVAARLREA